MDDEMDVVRGGGHGLSLGGHFPGAAVQDRGGRWNEGRRGLSGVMQGRVRRVPAGTPPRAQLPAAAEQAMLAVGPRRSWPIGKSRGD